jgi:hypothetical protein
MRKKEANAMETKDIVFDENYRLYTPIKTVPETVGLVLSDSLYAVKEPLTDAYKSKIAGFVNNVDRWYTKSVSAVLEWAKQEYTVDAQPNDLRLLNIYILYEQTADELYGLEFRAEFDVEHGVGLKINGAAFEIIEIGEGDTAFC